MYLAVSRPRCQRRRCHTLALVRFETSGRRGGLGNIFQVDDEIIACRNETLAGARVNSLSRHYLYCMECKHIIVLHFCVNKQVFNLNLNFLESFISIAKFTYMGNNTVLWKIQMSPTILRFCTYFGLLNIKINDPIELLYLFIHCSIRKVWNLGR